MLQAPAQCPAEIFLTCEGRCRGLTCSFKFRFWTHRHLAEEQNDKTKLSVKNGRLMDLP